MRRFIVLMAAWLAAAPAAASVSVVVSPPSASLAPNGVQQFTAVVSGSTNGSVRWFVNGVANGAPSTGIVTNAGLYTAPPDASARLNVVVEAVPLVAPSVTGVAAVAVAAGPPPSSLFHVAITGNDGNSGSATAPWRTIQHAAATAPAGTAVWVHAGVYNELVTITRSGSAAAGFLTLAAAPGEAAVIDGAGLPIPNGQNGLVTITDASWVRVRGFELRNYISKTTAAPVGVFVQGAGTHIEILDNHVHDIATTLKTAAGDALGVAVYGSAAPASINWLTVSGNVLDHLTTGFSESLSLSGNVTYWEVTRNVIHDNNNIGINIEGFYNTAPSPAYDYARLGLVALNTVYNITSKSNPAYGGALGADGIYINGGAYVTVQDNLVVHADIGIEMASEIPGRATVGVLAHANIIHHSYVTGLSLGGANLTANGGVRGCVVANNTLFADDTTLSGSGEVQIQYNATGNTIIDNIVFASAQGLLFNAFAPGATPALLDHNLYFTAGGAAPRWIWRGKSYGDLASLRANAGQEVHGVYADPQFINPAAGNFTISATSPAVALGAVLGLAGNGLTDYAGKPRVVLGTIDAGAYQH